MSVGQFAKKVRRSKARVYLLLQEWRIKGAYIDESGNWEIPEDAKLPARLRGGRKVLAKTKAAFVA